MKKNNQEKILLTGSNGFFGKIITSQFMVKDLFTLDLKGADYNIDISKNTPNVSFLNNLSKVIHCAGKAHIIPKTEQERQAFFDVNTKGTQNLLLGLEQNLDSLKQFIFISTVAVYGLIEGQDIKETQPTDANTPYGLSKLKAEKLVEDWCSKHNIQYLILRLPLLAGENARGNLSAIKKAITKGWYPKIFPNHARKSMVIAEDVAHLMKTWNGTSGIFHVTDGVHPTLDSIEKSIEKRVNKKIRLKIPLIFLKLLAKLGDIIEWITKKEFPISSLRLQKLTVSLTFDDTKAREKLKWKPNPVLQFLEERL